MANEHFGVIGASSAVDRRGGGKQSGGKEKRKAQRVEKSKVEVIVRNPRSVTKRAAHRQLSQSDGLTVLMAAPVKWK